MACTPLTVDAGLFIDVMSTSWSTAPNTAQGGKTVTRSSAGLTVTGPTGSLFMPTLGSHVLKYMFFGAGNFLVVLDSETGVGSITHRVFIIDFTTAGGPTDRLVLTGLASSSAVPPPNVQFSQGSGSAVLLFNSTGTEIQNLAIFRSDTGATLCAGPPPFAATGETQGEATATQLKIHYSSGGTSQTVTCPLPGGNCQVTPASPPPFPTAVVGGPASLATTTSAFTIHNNGTDCLTINAIGNVAPFSVAATSQPLPASLTPGQSMTVTVRFAPTMVGTFGPISLPITRAPARGDSALVCRGTARAPIPHLTVSPSSLGFGSVPVTTNANRSLTLVNNGELPLTVDVPASPAGSPFQWAQFSGLLAVGANHVIQVTFSPVAEGGFSASLGISTTPAAGPTSVAINGSGCIANAVIVPAPVAPINFGRVQQGLRMVRFLRFRNTGDGRLTFNARLTGPDAALYGLSTGSLTATAATQPYSADPITPCGPGPAGSGEAIVALVFFADGAPRTTAAQLIVDGHNGTNATPASWTYDLSAEVVPPIPTDAAIVLDRSGSMADLAGSRAKSEAAVARLGS